MTLPTECRWAIIFHGSVSELLSCLLEPLWKCICLHFCLLFLRVTPEPRKPFGYGWIIGSFACVLVGDSSYEVFPAESWNRRESSAAAEKEKRENKNPRNSQTIVESVCAANTLTEGLTWEEAATTNTANMKHHVLGRWSTGSSVRLDPKQHLQFKACWWSHNTLMFKTSSEPIQRQLFLFFFVHPAVGFKNMHQIMSA